MKDFKDELLKVLFKEYPKYVDIKYVEEENGMES